MWSFFACFCIPTNQLCELISHIKLISSLAVVVWNILVSRMSTLLLHLTFSELTRPNSPSRKPKPLLILTGPPAVLCDAPPPLLHGESSLSSPTVTVGTSVNFACDSGYTLVGASSLTCTAAGTFDGEPPRCQGKPRRTQGPTARRVDVWGRCCSVAPLPLPLHSRFYVELSPLKATSLRAERDPFSFLFCSSSSITSRWRVKCNKDILGDWDSKHDK